MGPGDHIQLSVLRERFLSQKGYEDVEAISVHLLLNPETGLSLTLCSDLRLNSADWAKKAGTAAVPASLAQESAKELI